MITMILNHVPERYFYTYGANEPSIHVEPGSTIITTTVDAGGRDQNGDLITEDMKQRIPGTTIRESNPLTGPFYVEGSEPGDTIVVKIMDIKLNRSYAYSAILSNFGCHTEEGPRRRFLFNPPLERKYFHWDLDHDRNLGILDLPESRIGKVEIPLEPFLGSIGVAPRFGRVEITLTPGEYGGNMDCVETMKGATLHLPVFHEGGYLVLGDVHAAQGDGELCGVGLETSAEVHLHVDLVKGQSLEWPRIEDDDWIMTACSSRPLMEAYKLAHYQMAEWLTKDYGFKYMDAIQVLSQVGRCRVGNVVDPNYTVVAKYPKKFLP